MFLHDQHPENLVAPLTARPETDSTVVHQVSQYVNVAADQGPKPHAGKSDRFHY